MCSHAVTVSGSTLLQFQLKHEPTMCADPDPELNQKKKKNPQFLLVKDETARLHTFLKPTVASWLLLVEDTVTGEASGLNALFW